MHDCIDIFTKEISALLGASLASVCLYGSVTLDDYRPGWSDIDILCLTAEPPTDAQAEELLTLRQSLVERENDPVYRSFEGAVVSLDEFVRGEYSTVVYWGTSGQRITDKYSFDVFSRLGLMKYGRLVCGSDVRGRIALPSHAELVGGVTEHLDCIRKNASQTGDSLYSCGWLLDIARCIYTLRNDDIISKTAAGEWALDEGICPCISDMEKTLLVRKDPQKYADLPETKAWLASLGDSVQTFADVLEKELVNHI